MSFAKKRFLSEESLSGESGRRTSQTSASSSDSDADDLNVSKEGEGAPSISFDDSSSSNSSSEDEFDSPVKKKKKMFYEETRNTKPSSIIFEEKNTPIKSMENNRGESSYHKSSLNTPGQFNSNIHRMMLNMGHVSGTGLGKEGKGRTEPVSLSNQKGRRGLGHKVKGLDNAVTQWDPSKENVSLKEPVTWVSYQDKDASPPEFSELIEWKKTGPRKETIDDEDHFISPDILQKIIQCKSAFDALDSEEMRRARTRSNPFETIKAAIFMNRAAVKMANIDSAFDFMFTDPCDQNGHPTITPGKDLLYFADVCAGPGGFSEYVLWKKKWMAKGFGFTLKEKNDFKIEDFVAGTPETFEPHYGVNGLDGDGDATNDANIKEFTKFVMKSTDNAGVHFMMADGGFSVEGKENIQEILSKRLYLCQFLVAMNIVAVNGHFVCKLFDLFTPFSVGLIYLMYRSFDSVSIFKPNTSRPANSERYIICKWKKENTKGVVKYMHKLNQDLQKKGIGLNGEIDSNVDINSIVPMSILKNDKDFFNYIYESNNLLGEYQIVGLAKIAAYTEDPSLHEMKQKEMRDNCLQLWKVPNQIRRNRSYEYPENHITQKLYDIFLSTPMKFNFNDASSPFDWKGVYVGHVDSRERPRTFFFSKGRSQILQYTETGWKRSNLRLELPAATLVYGEVVFEYQGYSTQRRQTVLHIIDAVKLGGICLKSMDLVKRNEYIESFVKAINKDTQKCFTKVRCKKLFDLERLRATTSEDLKLIMLKMNKARKVVACLPEDNFFIPSGVLFFRNTPSDFTYMLSKSHKKMYWCDLKNRRSMFERPSNAVSSFGWAFSQRLFWEWTDDVQVLPEQKVSSGSGIIHSSSIINHVSKILDS